MKAIRTRKLVGNPLQQWTYLQEVALHSFFLYIILYNNQSLYLLRIKRINSITKHNRDRSLKNLQELIVFERIHSTVFPCSLFG